MRRDESVLEESVARTLLDSLRKRAEAEEPGAVRHRDEARPGCFVWKKPRARRGRGGRPWDRNRMAASLVTTRPQARHVLAHRTTSALSENLAKTAESTSSGRVVPPLLSSSPASSLIRSRRARDRGHFLPYGGERWPRPDRRSGGIMIGWTLDGFSRSTGSSDLA
jgi:hypothetical protein